MSSKFGPKPLFDATIPTTTTQYIGVPVHKGAVGVYIAWTDAVGAATITLELTSLGADDAPVATAGSYEWKDSGQTITGPTATAAASTLINFENVRQSRARLKVVTTAITPLKVFNGVIA